MAIDLEILRLDLPEEDFSRPEGVSRFWRYSTFVLLLAAGVLAWLYLFQRSSAEDSELVPVRAYTVKYLAAEQGSTFTAGGWVEPAWPSPTKVSPLVNGRIVALHAVPGTDVAQGDVLAVIDDSLYRKELLAAGAQLSKAEGELGTAQAVLERLVAGARPEELQVSEAEVESAKAHLALLQAGFRHEDIAAAEARVRQAAARAAYTRSRAERYKRLATDNVAPAALAEEYESEAQAAHEAEQAARREFERLSAGYREIDLEQARSALKEAEQRHALLKAGTRSEVISEARAAAAAATALVAARRAELELAFARVEWCAVRAPAAGRVLEILIRQGGRVTDERPDILTLYDPSAMQARVDIRQEQAADLFVGQEVSLRLEARRDLAYMGRVTLLDPLANLARDTIRAKVTILEPDEYLRPDLTIRADFMPQAVSLEAGPVLVIPSGSVFRHDGRSYVFVISAGIVTRQEVALGQGTAQGLQVLSGLYGGELIAGSNLGLLRDGTAVRLLSEAE